MQYCLIIELVLHQKLKCPFFLLSVCLVELLSIPKIITFSLKPKFKIKKRDCQSNLTSYSEWKYLSESAFLVSLTASNKQSFNAKLECKSPDHIYNL